jgi:hypothetical protein
LVTLAVTQSMRHSRGEGPSYLGVGPWQDGGEFEKITAAGDILQFPDVARPFDKLFEKLREGIRALSEALMETEV